MGGFWAVSSHKSGAGRGQAGSGGFLAVSSHRSGFRLFQAVSSHWSAFKRFHKPLRAVSSPKISRSKLVRIQAFFRRGSPRKAGEVRLAVSCGFGRVRVPLRAGSGRRGLWKDWRTKMKNRKRVFRFLRRGLGWHVEMLPSGGRGLRSTNMRSVSCCSSHAAAAITVMLSACCSTNLTTLLKACVRRESLARVMDLYVRNAAIADL